MKSSPSVLGVIGAVLALPVIAAATTLLGWFEPLLGMLRLSKGTGHRRLIQAAQGPK